MTVHAGEDEPSGRQRCAVPAIARQPIAERISPPTPEIVRETRLAAGLSQTEAAELVSSAQLAAYKTWAGYETPVGHRNHRKIPYAVWELFLLLVGEHPSLRLASRE